MNISIPHSWLKEYLKTSAGSEKIGELLSLCGPSVEKIRSVAGDAIYDIEVTTNRVDMMSVLGIAREAAAILPQFGFKAAFLPPKLDPISPPQTPLPLTVKDPNGLCPRILAVVLDQVSLGPSPQKIKSRLEAAGLRSLNNVVDVTNYVMTEVGHPTHVFDYDRVSSHSLLLRKAKPGEKITSLEDKTYALPGGDIVIDDGSGEIIDLPGIIGTANSVVTPDTKRIIFFLEANNPVKIRRTSMTLGIRTVAATLNEKGVDPELGSTALKRGVMLLKELTGAKVASKIFDLYPQKPTIQTIKLPLQLIKDRLGVDISGRKVKQILENLGFFFSIDKNEQLSVKPASFRTKDIAIPEDIVEEVARIYGYHKLPSKLPLTQIPTNYPDENFHLEYRLKNILADSGLNEIYTNSMVSRALTSQSGFSINNHLKIKNALSADWQYLRRSLIPSHLEAIGQNPQAKSVSFFELANTYQLRPGKLPEEKLTLLLSTTNDFRYLKGVVDLTLQKLHLAPTFKPQNAVKTPWLDGHTAAIILKNQTLGCLGQVLTPEGFPHKQVNVALFDFRALSQASRAYPAYQPLSPHPPIIEDLTFTLPEKTYLGPVIAAIASCHRLVKAVALTKTYRQNYTFNVTYQSPTQPLTDKAVAPVRKKIVVSLKQKFSADLVGNLR